MKTNPGNGELCTKAPPEASPRRPARVVRIPVGKINPPPPRLHVKPRISHRENAPEALAGRMGFAHRQSYKWRRFSRASEPTPHALRPLDFRFGPWVAGSA